MRTEVDRWWQCDACVIVAFWNRLMRQQFDRLSRVRWTVARRVAANRSTLPGGCGYLAPHDWPHLTSYVCAVSMHQRACHLVWKWAGDARHQHPTTERTHCANRLSANSFNRPHARYSLFHESIDAQMLEANRLREILVWRSDEGLPSGPSLTNYCQGQL